MAKEIISKSADELLNQAFSKEALPDELNNDKVEESVSEEAVVATEKPKETNNGQESTSSSDARTSQDGQQGQVKPNEGTSNEQSTIPLWVLKEEKEKRRALEAKLQALEEAQKAPPPPVPDKTTEYDSWLEHQIQTVQETQKQIQERQALDEIGKSYATSAQMFVAQNPDYENCVSNMIEIYAMQLAEDGYDQKQIEAAAQYQIMQMTVEAMKRGFSPAEYIYRKGSKLPRLERYTAQNGQQKPLNGTQVPQQEQKPVKKDVDIGRLAQAKKLNNGISGDTGEVSEAKDKIMKENTLNIAFGTDKAKLKEWNEARERLLKRI